MSFSVVVCELIVEIDWLIDGILYSLYLSVLTSLIFLTFTSIFVSGKLNLRGGFIIVDKWTGKNIILFSKSSKQFRLWMCYMWNGKKIFESKFFSREKTILSLNEFYYLVKIIFTKRILHRTTTLSKHHHRYFFVIFLGQPLTSKFFIPPLDLPRVYRIYRAFVQ